MSSMLSYACAKSSCASFRFRVGSFTIWSRKFITVVEWKKIYYFCRMEEVEYKDYTQEDATKDGIGYVVSRLSKKVLLNGNVIGKIIIEDNSLRISKAFIDSIKDKDAKTYYQNLNITNSFYLRKIWFDKTFLYSGKLENFFDYTMNNMPTWSLLWCVPNICGKSFIEQLGGFVPPLYPIPNDKIRLFSLDI